MKRLVFLILILSACGAQQATPIQTQQLEQIT